MRPACHRDKRSLSYPEQHNEFAGKTWSWNSVYLARAGRSAGGDKGALLGRKKAEHERGDERILGSGDFVSEIIQESEKRWEETTWDRITLAALIQEVAEHMGISPSALLSQSRDRNISRARAIISYLAVKEAGYTQTEIENHLNISRIGVRNSILRGEKIVDICQKIWKEIS